MTRIDIDARALAALRELASEVALDHDRLAPDEDCGVCDALARWRRYDPGAMKPIPPIEEARKGQ